MKVKIINMLRRIFFASYYMVNLIYIPMLYNKAYRRGTLSYLPAEDFEIWKKSMLKMLKEFCQAGNNFKIRQVINSFAKSKIHVIRKCEIYTKNTPIVVLCVKNDLRRIQMLVDHYRMLGVERFAIMDNGSDDGTYEWLLAQQDIDLYRCFEKYKTKVKEGWMNRIISYYGFDHWYLLTDSDELLTYIGMEEHPLSDIILYAQKNGIKRIKGLTIDMYSSKSLFEKTDDIQKEFRWMDTDTYFEKETVAGKQKFKHYVGGPRYRLMDSCVKLSKYPLVYFDKGTISDNAHYQFPHELLPLSPCYFGILHYKFLDTDFDEYKKRALKDSGYYLGGHAYKQIMKYIETAGRSGFFYSGSIEYKNSDSLINIPIIKKIPF